MKILENVFVKDINKLNNKLKDIKKDGVTKLHIVSDFDKTLNKEFLKTGKYKSAISLIRDGNYLENNYSKRAYALYDKYHPYEIDLNISFIEKKEKMKEWWQEHIKLLSECKMNKDVINDILSKETLELREGVDSFLKICFEKKIPLLIFSSGVGDIINGFLITNNLSFPNTHIISNFFDWDENGFAKPYYKGNKTIHMLNKDETEIKNTSYFQEIETRANVIVMGDSLEDIKMISGLEHKNIISIGFLNSDVENKLETYKNIFDVVIVNDGSFMQVLEILNEIILD
jgi:cytosolic 5'-nucleotidase 3